MNGTLLADADARISVFDHGLTVGDGVFETVKISGGVPFALTRHLARLRASPASACRSLIWTGSGRALRLCWMRLPGRLGR
jgi:hypothetical protein